MESFGKLERLKYEAKSSKKKSYLTFFGFIDFPDSLLVIHLIWPAIVAPATLWVSAYYQQGSNQIIVGYLSREINKSCLCMCLIVLSLEHKSQEMFCRPAVCLTLHA